ncbi:MAG: hypothetical protein JRN20_15065 [Nitrososphaerota archaeon]|nr:hypothetical protein [Nitrososphaerota archaeon]
MSVRRTPLIEPEWTPSAPLIEPEWTTAPLIEPEWKSAQNFGRVSVATIGSRGPAIEILW